MRLIRDRLSPRAVSSLRQCSYLGGGGGNTFPAFWWSNKALAVSSLYLWGSVHRGAEMTGVGLSFWYDGAQPPRFDRPNVCTGTGKWINVPNCRCWTCTADPLVLIGFGDVYGNKTWRVSGYPVRLPFPALSPLLFSRRKEKVLRVLCGCLFVLFGLDVLRITKAVRLCC